MAFPIWDSFISDTNKNEISKAEELRKKILKLQEDQYKPFSDDEKLANLHLILKTAQLERKKMEMVYKKMQIEMQNMKRTANHPNIGGEGGPTVDLYSGYFAVI